MRHYFGNAAHLIVGDSCRFHIATQIGDYLISTVGEYYPPNAQRPQTIGYNRLYETMVFHVTGECQCGCGLPAHAGSELDFEGYNTARAATEGHEQMCQKYEALVSTPAESAEGTR